MRITNIEAPLRAAGLIVKTYKGWGSLGDNWTPIGAMQHHTAGSSNYPVGALFPKYAGGTRSDHLVKANVFVDKHGVVHLIADGHANYSGGGGSSVVYKETKRNVAPKDTAYRRGLKDDMYANRFYISCEAAHPGDGSSMPAVQEEAIIRMWAVIFKLYGWNSNRLIGHTEWTRRKIDPMWNGSTNRTPYLRDRLASAFSGALPDLPPTQPLPTPGEDEMLEKGAKGVAVTLYQKAIIAWDKIALPRYGADGDFGNETVFWVSKFQVAHDLPSTGTIGAITADLLSTYIGNTGTGSQGPTGPRGPQGLPGKDGKTPKISVSY